MLAGAALHEQKKYEDAWSIPEYYNHSPGAGFVDYFIHIAEANGADFAKHKSVLDVGAGSGAASRVFKDRGFQVAAFDITDTAWKHDDIHLTTGCLWRGIPVAGIFDHAYCCDVMEHIPTQFVALSVREIKRRANKAFFSISFSPDYFGGQVGEPLHLTVKPFVWWRDCLREVSTVLDARDLGGEGVFYIG